MSAKGSLLVGSLPPTRIVVCVNCTGLTRVPCPFPLMLRSYGDLPLPEGWQWVEGVIPAVGTEPVCIPLCGDCARLGIYDLDGAYDRRDRARDLKIPGSIAERG